MERKVGTREIHGPEDCPYARIFGCHPDRCSMIYNMGIYCPMAPIEIEAEVVEETSND